MSQTRQTPANLLLHVGLIAGAVGLARWPTFAAAWSRWMQGDPLLLVVVGLSALSLASTWICAGLYGLLGLRRAPSWLYRYKIQPERPRPGQPTLRETLALSLFNGLVLLPLVLLGFYALLRLRGWAPTGALPTLGGLVLQILGLTVFTDLFFYLGHRFLHRPWWMAHVHHVHHRWAAPTGLASQFQHPLEYVLTGVAPLALAGLILAPDPATIAVFTVLGSVNVVATHSGYDLPFAPWAGHHDLHHARTVGNFGVTDLFDRLFGTRIG